MVRSSSGSSSRSPSTPRATRSHSIGVELDVRLPAALPYPPLAAHLGRAVGSPSERVEGDDAAVAFRGPGGAARLAWTRRGRDVRLRLDTPRGRPTREETGAALDLFRRLFGLATDPGPFERHAAGVQGFERLCQSREGLRIPQTRDVFDGIVWVIVGQQVNLALAYRMRARLIEHCGDAVGDGLIAPPSPEKVAELDPEDLRRLGFSRSKAEYLSGIARRIASGELDLGELSHLPAPEVERRLLALRGLGPWSVQYLMMRALGSPDCVPAQDVGLHRALQEFLGLRERPTAAATRRLLEPLAPHRSLATFHLWTRLAQPPAPRDPEDPP